MMRVLWPGPTRALSSNKTHTRKLGNSSSSCHNCHHHCHHHGYGRMMVCSGIFDTAACTRFHARHFRYNSCRSQTLSLSSNIILTIKHYRCTNQASSIPPSLSSPNIVNIEHHHHKHYNPNHIYLLRVSSIYIFASLHSITRERERERERDCTKTRFS